MEVQLSKGKDLEVADKQQINKDLWTSEVVNVGYDRIGSWN